MTVEQVQEIQSSQAIQDTLSRQFKIAHDDNSGHLSDVFAMEESSDDFKALDLAMYAYRLANDGSKYPEIDDVISLSRALYSVSGSDAGLRPAQYSGISYPIHGFNRARLYSQKRTAKGKVRFQELQAKERELGLLSAEEQAEKKLFQNAERMAQEMIQLRTKNGHFICEMEFGPSKELHGFGKTIRATKYSGKGYVAYYTKLVKQVFPDYDPSKNTFRLRFEVIAQAWAFEAKRNGRGWVSYLVEWPEGFKFNGVEIVPLVHLGRWSDWQRYQESRSLINKEHIYESWKKDILDAVKFVWCRKDGLTGLPFQEFDGVRYDICSVLQVGSEKVKTLPSTPEYRATLQHYEFHGASSTEVFKGNPTDSMMIGDCHHTTIDLPADDVELLLTGLQGGILTMAELSTSTCVEDAIFDNIVGKFDLQAGHSYVRTMFFTPEFLAKVAERDDGAKFLAEFVSALAKEGIHPVAPIAYPCIDETKNPLSHTGGASPLHVDGRKKGNMINFRINGSLRFGYGGWGRARLDRPFQPLEEFDCHQRIGGTFMSGQNWAGGVYGMLSHCGGLIDSRRINDEAVRKLRSCTVQLAGKGIGPETCMDIIMPIIADLVSRAKVEKWPMYSVPALESLAAKWLGNSRSSVDARALLKDFNRSGIASYNHVMKVQLTGLGMHNVPDDEEEGIGAFVDDHEE